MVTLFIVHHSIVIVTVPVTVPVTVHIISEKSFFVNTQFLEMSRAKIAQVAKSCYNQRSKEQRSSGAGDIALAP
jgi:hypothetical protein